MIIRIPEFAKDLEDEGIILFLAFMLRMTKKNNNTKFGNGYKGIRYYMHVSDIRYFLRKWIMSPEKLGIHIHPYALIGKASSKIWMFEWKRSPKTVTYDLVNPELCAVWGYVIGRDVASELVTDMPSGKFPKEKDSVLTSRYDREFFKYFGNREKE